MRIMFGQLMANPPWPSTASIRVLGVGGGGGVSSPPSCGRNVNGTPKMLTYSGSNSPDLGVDLVGRAAQAAADHLLAEELAGEGAQPHDVRHGLGVPAFREHPDGDHVLDLLAGLARPGRRCPP